MNPRPLGRAIALVAAGALGGGFEATATAQPVPPLQPVPPPVYAQPAPQQAQPPAYAQSAQPAPGQPMQPVQPQIIVMQPGMAIPPGAIIVQSNSESGSYAQAFTLPYMPGDVVPPGYRPVDRPSRALLAAGLSTFFAAYLPSTIVTIVAESDAGDGSTLPLLIPVVGPLVTVGTSGANDAGAYFLALDALTQAAGVVMFGVAFAVRDHSLTRDAPTFSMRVAPTPGGASLHLTF